MTRPIISVLITVYREGEILRDTLDSVMKQSYQDFEVIVVENNADELSLSVLKDYAKKFPKTIRLVSQPIQGVPSARNKGLKESSGQYIAMCDGDDVMYPNRLERQLSFFQENKGHISLLSSEYDLVNWSNDQIIEKSKKDKSSWMKYLDLRVSFRSHPSTWFFEKEKAIAVGMFNEEYNPRLIEDDDFNFKMFLKGDLVCLPESLVRVRFPSKDYLDIKNEQAPTASALYKLDIFFSTLYNELTRQSAIAFNPKGFKKIRSQWLREMGTGFLSYTNGKAVGRHLIFEALVEEPFNIKNWKAFSRSFYKKYFFHGKHEKILSESDLKNILERKFFVLKTLENLKKPPFQSR
ncbi:MAG: glycosyltransferase family 2 protein [Thermodesulfobium sp.]